MIKTQKFIDRQFMLSTKFELYHYIDTDHINVPKHQHEFYELYHFISGEVEYEVQDLRCELYPGDTLLISPHVLHKPLIRSSTKYERIVLWIGSTLVEHLISDSINPISFPTSENDFLCIYHWQDTKREIRSQLQNLYNLKEKKSQYTASCCNSLISYLFTLCHLLAEPQFQEHTPQVENQNLFRRTKSKNAMITQIARYLDKNFSQDLTIDAISKSFGISLHYLNHQFKQQIGLTPYQYLLQRRLLIARDLINRGESATTAAMRSGFQDYSCFFRAFKKLYGLTPSAYMDSIT